MSQTSPSSPKLQVALTPVRLKFLRQIVAQMLSLARGMIYQNVEKGLISNRIARQISKHIYLVECALRRLLVLIAFQLTVKPHSTSVDLARMNDLNSEKTRNCIKFPLSELADLSLGRRAERPANVPPFWETFSADAGAQKNDTYRSPGVLWKRAHAIAHVLDNLDRFALRLARRKVNDKARNPLGIPIIICPLMPSGRRGAKIFGQSLWLEITALNYDAKTVLRHHWRGRITPPP